MKIIKFLFVYSIIAVLAISCEKGLDPINSVDPGTDMEDPTVVINYPIEGKPFIAPTEVATLTIKFLATDDFELKSVVLDLDGTVIGTISTFKDYRRADMSYNYDNLTDGDHVLTVTVKDLLDNTVSATVNFSKITAGVYNPLDGEVFYLPFDGHYLNMITGEPVTVVGSPGFAEGKVNDAYAGATDSYITHPSDGIIGESFSVSFWYQINADPNRAGIFMISAPTDIQTQDRTKGLRFAREADGLAQKFWFNIGNGSTDFWFVPASFPVTDEWMHIALTVSPTHAIVYLNGEIAAEGDYEGPIDWTDCATISIMSGEPNVIYWDHYSDLSLMDELHLFNKELTEAEVQSLYSVKK